MNLKEFKNPPKEYRPTLFWSWNNLLSTSELRRQVQDFAEKGFGGYFMHARIGLATPYLSEEWMECVEACLEEGVKKNIDSWLYDEDKWPSGFAGGILTTENDEYRSRMLTMRELKKENLEECFKDPSILAVFEVKFSSQNSIESFKRLLNISDATGNGKIIGFKVETGERSNWYNGESYVDLLNPRVTEEFLRVTVDEYAKHFKEELGKHIPGVFTDEPNFCTSWGPSEELPWTDGMPEYFLRLNGYNLTDRLPLLFFDGDCCNRVRYDFWKTVTRRFLESWTIPYSRKCDAYKLKMTGHYLCEDNLVIQTRYIGAAMPHYEYMHIPGIDHLGRNINDALTLKQCSSIAHQFGRKRVLCEIFGCSGHSMTFEDQKWIADFHFALGINFLCLHLALYTLKGDGKRDFPPTISYHQPYWPYYKLMNDYFSRASYLCSQGSFYSDLLVLNPIGSVWATYAPSLVGKYDSTPWKYNDAFVRLIESLLMLHWEFDIGDEIIMEKHAEVSEKGIIRVKDASYKLVIIPPSLTWSRSTFSLIEKFLNSKGKVIFFGEPPKLIDGISSEGEWRRLLSHPNAQKISGEINDLNNALEKVLERSVSIRDELGNEIRDIYFHHRVEGSQHIFFFSNKSREPRNANLFFKEKGRVYELDLQSGDAKEIEVTECGDRMVIRKLFPPAGSNAYLIDVSKPIVKTSIKPSKGLVESVIRLPDFWGFERLHLNSLTLDNCQYAIGDEEWSKTMPTWRVRREVLERTGLSSYNGIQPWVLLKRGVLKKEFFELRLKSTFRTEVKPRRIYLVLERASAWRLFVNGVQVPTETDDWYWDRQMGRVEISDYVEIGNNIIELSCNYSLEIPIEDIYIVGDFAVEKRNNRFVLTGEPECLKSGNWVDQGYPFYAGTMRYKSKFNLDSDDWDRVLLRFPEARGTLFLIYVNRGEPIPVCWRPLEADITRFVKTGENTLEIDVASSLRNTFGPLHHRLGDSLTFVGPETFIDEENWVEEYQFAPYGLIKGVEVVVKRIVS
jgi:hypothetical protein